MTNTPQSMRAELTPLETALQQEQPRQPCHVYRIDVGGESYVGMTSLSPGAALNNHIEQARSGDGSPLHKAMRRFGYACDVELVSSHDTEVECLVSKVSQIKRTKPTLNSTFGGEGFNFNLVEMPNELGEMVLFVEDKSLKRRLKILEQKLKPAYYSNLLAKIRARYDKLEGKLPGQRSAHASQLWPTKEPYIPNGFPIQPEGRRAMAHDLQKSRAMEASRSNTSNTVSSTRRLIPSQLMALMKMGSSPEEVRADLAAYLRSRKDRYSRLRTWSAETQKSVMDHENLIEFIKNFDFELKSKPKVLSDSDMHRLRSTLYNPRLQEDEFISGLFPGAQRVFTIFGSRCDSSKMFKDMNEIKSLLINESWFRDAIVKNILRPGDAIHGFNLCAGQYGGFLGFFTKEDYKVTHLLVDQELVDQIHGSAQTCLNLESQSHPKVAH